MKRLLTTPIYYVNDVPHIGHAYTTIIADMLKKYYSLCGHEVFFLTGTDEHGQKIEDSAKKKGIQTIEYVNSISEKFRHTWQDFEIDFDKFIRTTYLEHILSVQKAFEIMYSRGDIYKGEYEGLYCVSCETFFTKTQVIDDMYCPDCGKEINSVKEESYFFALSKYQDKLLQWYRENEDCIMPNSKRQEIIKFVESGLHDLSITRTSFEWGIKTPLRLKDHKHIIYVWLDALINYISALGYGLDYNDAKEQLSYRKEQNPCLESKMEFFNHTTHVVGKDILKFHAIYWPAFLLSLNLPMPKHIFAHGWWTIDGVKMSKSIGNVISPMSIKEAYPLDVFRYFMLREVSFGQDGDFSESALINRNNGELSNDLGNLLSRLIGMAEKYFSLSLKNNSLSDYSLQKDEIAGIINNAMESMSQMKPHKYLEEIWRLLSMANTLIAEKAPWEMMKNGREKECEEFLCFISNILSKVALLVYPVMPKSCEKIAKALGISIDSKSFDSLVVKGEYLLGFNLLKSEALFPKIESARMKQCELPQKDEKNGSQNGKNENSKALISKSDFEKMDIRLGTIIDAEEMSGSKKLLKLQIDLGEGKPRQIISGIKEFYSAKGLIGTQVCVLANLKPAKLMGEISEGMILSCEDSSGLSLLGVESKRDNGAVVG